MTAYEEVDENPTLVAEIYAELMEEQNRATEANLQAMVEKGEKRAKRAAEYQKKKKKIM